MTRPTWDPGAPIDNIDELTEALGVDSDTAFDEYVDGRLEPYTYGDGCQLLSDHFVLFSGLFGAVRHDIDFPTTLDRFESSMDLLGERLGHMWSAYSAVQDPSGSTTDITADLAAFFNVSNLEFVQNLGGGWFPIDGSQLVGYDQAPLSWFATGDPVEVVLGLGEEYVSVVATDGIEYGVQPGDEVRAGEPFADVPLRQHSTVPSLGEAVRRALEVPRSRWDHCAGCRRYTDDIRDVTYEAGRFCMHCSYELGLVKGVPLPPKPKRSKSRKDVSGAPKKQSGKKRKKVKIKESKKHRDPGSAGGKPSKKAAKRKRRAAASAAQDTVT